MAAIHTSRQPCLNDVFASYCLRNHCEWQSALLQIAHLHSCVSFCSDISTDSSVLQTSQLGLTRLPEKRLILCGKLTNVSRQHTGDGQWFRLQDDTGTIRCQLSQGVARHVSRYVICTRWNYMISDMAGAYLEIGGATLLPAGESPSPELVPVLSVTSAAHLHGYRELLATQLVNLEARLIAVSEVISIQDDEVVMLKLCDVLTYTTISVIIKNTNFLYWRYVLEVGETYVFQKLKPTTLYKDDEMEQKIYTVTSNSQVQPCVKTSCVRRCLNEWIGQFGKKPFSVDDIDEFGGQYSKAVTPLPEDMFSFQGVITSCDQAHHGIYIIDEVKTLYLCHPPSGVIFRCLRVGTCIHVSHIHSSAPSQPASVKLYGCVFSRIQIVHFSPYDNSAMNKNSPSSLILSLIGQHGLHVSHIDWLLNAEAVLRRKFYPDISHPCSITEHLLSATLRTLQFQNAVQLPRQLVNPLLEFINHDAQSCAQTAKKVEPLVSLHLVTIREVVDLLLEREPRSQGVTFSGQAASHWKYVVSHSRDLSPNLIVIGVLKSDKKTTNLQLADRTAAIVCVTAPVSSGHCCSDRCLQCPAVGQAYICPFASISSVGDVLRVDLFYIIEERFEQSAPVRYLVFSMCDTVRLSNESRRGHASHHMTDRLSANTHSSVFSEHNNNHHVIPIKRNSSTESARLSENVENPSKLKHCKASHRSDISFPSLNLPSTSFPLIVQLFVVLSKTSPSIRSRVDDTPQLSFVASTRFAGGPLKLTCSDDSGHCLRSNELATSPHVALFFCDSAVRWYQFLQPGGVYGLVRMRCDDATSILGQRPRSTLERVITAANVRQCVRVDDNFDLIPAEVITKHLTKQCLLSTMLKEYSESAYNSFVNVRDVCVHRSSVQVVSIRGQIVSRVSLENCSKPIRSDEGRQKTERNKQKLGMSTAGDVRLRLVLRDVDTSDEMLIYLTLADLSYPLALLPGVVVALGGLEAHPPSRRGNIYCHFTCASSCHVIGIAELNSSSTVTSLASTSDLTSHLRISQLWHPLTAGHPAATGSFQCVCFVQRVLRVCLQRICARCSQARHLCRCPSRDEERMFKANASFMIDDGSGSALVYCEGDSVQQLLNLSDPQWTELKLNTDSESHSYNSRSPEASTSDMEILLRYLCVSESTLRPVVLTARYQNNQQRRIAKMDLEDFELKTLEVERRELKTRLLPLITLQLVTMETVDHLYYSNALIVKKCLR